MSGRDNGQPRPGTGFAPCHHGELLQGIFRDTDGSTCQALLTLPMRGLGSFAEFRPRPDSAPDDIPVLPADRRKARSAASLTIRASERLLGIKACGGQLSLRSTVPIGLGMGSSTSDIIAAVRAVAAAFGAALPGALLARLAVRAEHASDPLMLADRPVLFAQREGRVVEDFGGALPSMVVLGCTTGGATPVDTLTIPGPPRHPSDVDEFERLRDTIRIAVATGDAALLGKASTESARRNQRMLYKAELDNLERIAASSGAVGIQVAHSGNVAGLLFDRGAPELAERIQRAQAALRGAGLRPERLFATGTRDAPGSGCVPVTRRRQPHAPRPPAGQHRH